MSNSDNSTDNGQETSTYGRNKNYDSDVPEPEDNPGELNYLVELVTSSEQEDKAELANLLNIAKTTSTQTSHQTTSSTSVGGMKTTADTEAVNALIRQHKALQNWSQKKRANSQLSQELNSKKKAKTKPLAKPLVPKDIEIIDVDADVKPSPEELKLKKKKEKLAAKQLQARREKDQKTRSEHQFTLTQHTREFFQKFKNILEEPIRLQLSTVLQSFVSVSNSATKKESAQVLINNAAASQGSGSPASSANKNSPNAFSSSVATKKPSNANPVTKEKSKPAPNKTRPICQWCNDWEKYCHSKDFGTYCVQYTQVMFSRNPSSWSQQLTSQTFIKAYNRILDYVKFRRSKAKVLIPEAKYFPPACLKGDLDYVKFDIKEDIADLLKGERDGTITIEVDWQQREDNIRSQDDVIGQINGRTVDSEIIDKLAACELNCPNCLLPRKDCHDYNFGEYCTKKNKRYFQLFPTAMTRDNAREFFISKYHAALHVLIWAKYDHLADERHFLLHPPCLENTMEQVLEEVDDAHHEVCTRRHWKNITDWRELNMDFDGTDMGRI